MMQAANIATHEEDDVVRGKVPPFAGVGKVPGWSMEATSRLEPWASVDALPVTPLIRYCPDASSEPVVRTP